MNKTKFTLIALILIALFVIAVFGLLILRGDEDTWLCVNGQWVRHGQPEKPMPAENCPGATNQNSNLNTGLANPASVNCEQKGGKIKIIEDANGIKGGQIGICTFSDGSKCEEWAYLRNECQVGNKIVVYWPLKNQEVALPLTITGEAKGNWFFEASFPIKLLDSIGNSVGQAVAQAQGDWMTTDFVPFTATIEGTILSQSGQIPLTLVLQRDNPSGLPQNDEQILIPLILNQPETTKVKVYLGSTKFDPQTENCGGVYPLERIVNKTPAIGQAALQALLAGPTADEKAQGYFTSINQGVKINSLTINDGVAKVDFDQTLQQNVGGSCRVAAISAQIIQTLKQFPTVKNVIISVNGDSETALQP